MWIYSRELAFVRRLDDDVFPGSLAHTPVTSIFWAMDMGLVGTSESRSGVISTLLRVIRRGIFVLRPRTPHSLLRLLVDASNTQPVRGTAMGLICLPLDSRSMSSRLSFSRGWRLMRCESDGKDLRRWLLRRSSYYREAECPGQKFIISLHRLC